MHCRAAALATLLLAYAAFAQSTVFLEELTSPELQAAVRGGKTIILIPIGGTEWNSSHMVLGKHNARARFLAGKIAERAGNAIVAPVIAYVPEGRIDPPTQHMRHPGTITVPEDAFEKSLEGAARSLRHHGFRDIVFLGDHGGYHRSLRKVAERLNREWKERAVHVPGEYYREMEHAGVEDTAMTLGFDPALVRDPRGASAEKGRAALDATIERTAEAVRRAARR